MSLSTNEFTTPVGRLVAGSLYQPQTTDLDGNPLVTKTGANAGQPRVNYFFAIAIKKGAEQHWADTDWGRVIWAEGTSKFPQTYNAPAFAWKITNGDDREPFNARGTARKVLPADREGYPGHWILAFSGGNAPRLCTLIGTKDNKPAEYSQENGINPGDYIQVLASVSGNNSPTQSGVYLNHRIVCMMGYGERILLSRSFEDAGFGGQLPPGASLTPKATTLTAPQTIASPAPVPAAVAPYVPAPVAAPAVSPHYGILNPVAPVPAPVVAPPAPAPVIAPAPVKTIKPHATFNPEGKFTYDQMIAHGWTDAVLTQHGLI